MSSPLNVHTPELSLISMFVKSSLASVASTILAECLSWGEVCPLGAMETFFNSCNWESYALLTCKGIDVKHASEGPTLHTVASYNKEMSSTNYSAKVEMPYTVANRYDWFLPRPGRSLSPYALPADIKNVH